MVVGVPADEVFLEDRGGARMAPKVAEEEARGGMGRGTAEELPRDPRGAPLAPDSLVFPGAGVELGTGTTAVKPEWAPVAAGSYQRRVRVPG